MREKKTDRNSGFFGQIIGYFFNFSEFGSPKVRLGKKYLRKKKYDKAIDAFYEALAYNAQDKEAFIGIGDSLSCKGEQYTQEAIGCYQKATRIDPFYVLGYEKSIDICLKFNLKKKAIEERKKLSMIKILKENPESSIMNNNLGVFLLKQNQYKQALNYFQKSVLYDLSFKKGYVNYSIAMYKYATSIDDPTKSSILFQKVLDATKHALKFGNDLTAVIIKIRAYIRLKKFTEALEWCNNGKEIDPGCKEIFNLEKIILKEKARDQYKKSFFKNFNKKEEIPEKSGVIVVNENDFNST